jgi:lysophospholipase L1-like esterase
MRRLSALLLASLLLASSAGTSLAAGGSSFDHARRYSVALGDSLAASVQPTGDPADLYRTSEGYAEQLLALARAEAPKLSLVKLACPGETTTTMIEGGICAYAHGSQLDEALAFIRGHRSLIAFITLDIGANDFPCQQPECVPVGVAAIQANLPPILAAIRAAAGPDVPVVGMSLYNPLLGSWLLGPEGQAYAQASAVQIGSLNGLLRAIYAAGGARVADVEGAFSSSDFATQVPVPGLGTLPLNVARICQWTWVCAPPPLGPNNHANAAGYGVMAAAFAAELGL